MVAIYVILFIVVGEVLSFSVKDDLPVLEHLGCEDCERVYVPVCGTDDKTYTNSCKLNCANSKRKKTEWVFIKRFGPCIDIGIIFKD